MTRQSRVSIRDWPRLTRFYGISPAELQDLPHALITMYADSLPQLHSEEILERMLVADMPWAEKGDRNRIRNSYLRELSDEDTAPEKIDVHTEGGVQQAATFGIRVELPETPSTDEEE